jgi:Sodium/hydrogen exchanger family
VNVSPIFALAGLITIGLLVPRLTSIPWPRVPSLDLLVAAGGALVALGFVLGPGIDFLDRPTLAALAPVTALAIGWIGAGFGARFEWRYLRRIPRSAWLLAALSSAAALTTVAFAAWVATRFIPGLGAAWTPRVPAILTLGALAAATGPGAVALVLRIAGVPPRAARAVVLAATLETACAVVAMSVPLALHRRGGAVIAWLAWIALALGSGALVGMVFVWLARTRVELSRAELTFVVVITLFFAAGMGSATGVSPFVTCFLAAALIVNVSPRRHAVRGVLTEAERPIYAVLLLVAGALLALPTAWILPAALVLWGVRAAAKWAAVRFAREAGGPFDGARGSRNMGLATIAQGGAVVALGVSYALLYGGGALLATVVLLVAMSQLSAPGLLALALRAESPEPALTQATAPPELSANVPVEWPR